MQTIINIASIKDGDQELIVETKNPQEVEAAVQTLEEKVKSGGLVYGKHRKTGESIHIQKENFKQFIKSNRYEEKAVTNFLGGG